MLAAQGELHVRKDRLLSPLLALAVLLLLSLVLLQLRHAPRIKYPALPATAAPSHRSGQYRGAQWTQQTTLAVETVAETEFARCQMHTVRTKGNKVVADWLWFDEGDHINVLVQLTPAAASGLQPRRTQPADTKPFLVFEQTKYALEGKTLAPVGGYIEPGETAEAAVRRELLEEAQLVAGRVLALRSFRTAANRGGGYCHCFLALDCTLANTSRVSDDLETQDVRLLSRAELMDALMAGRFQEVKWTATIALALLSGHL